MVGTLLNVATILIGGLIGLVAGSRIPTKFRETLVSAMGLFTLAYGILMFGETANILIPLASLVLGTILGEWLKIEDGLEHLGQTLQAKVNRSDQPISASARRFVDGFVTTSLLFCIGPMAILGSIQDSISGDFQMLAVKAVLDGLAAMAFASTLGVGVLFSAAIVLIYQGAISLLAQWIGQGFSTAVVNEMSAVGGVILAGIAISNLLEIKKIRTGNFLPALFLAIAIVLVLNALGVSY
jgi:hypothetical protein